MSIRPFVFISLFLAVGSAADAQPLGTFRWQLQPYCNVVTLAVTQTGGVYTLDGFDDQCGAATRAPITGTAVTNPNGTIEIGLNVVVSPHAAPLHVAVPLNVPALDGPWRDSAGNTGNFVFTPGAGTGGNPRPASAAIGAVAIDPAQVQLRVSGSCPTGQVIQGINQDGTVACATGGAVGITAVSTPAGGGLQGGANEGTAALALATTASGAFNFSNNYGFVSGAPNNVSEGSLAVSGPGKRLLWYPRKTAFRVGSVVGDHWDDQYIGIGSVAMGINTFAPGGAAFAMGRDTQARGGHSLAIGYNNIAGGAGSIALGEHANALAHNSFIFSDGAEGIPVFALTNQFVVRAVGGTTLYTTAGMTNGVKLMPGDGSWRSVSDVNMKENFRELDGDDVLAKIARMPIREWNYKSQDAAIRHVGPTAQDFYAAFGLGGDDPLLIGTIDADGIALAGVKALASENQALKAALAALSQRLDRLERKQP